MTELEKLRTFTELCMYIFQHYNLKVKPDWFSCDEGWEGYSDEVYHIGWQKHGLLAEIDLSRNNDKEYKFLIAIYRNKSDLNSLKWYDIKDLLTSGNTDLTEFIEFINNNFKEC